MDRDAGRFPKEFDLVSVWIKRVEYFGYVDAVDYDLRAPTVRVEFFPGIARDFALSEVTLVSMPTALTAATA